MRSFLTTAFMLIAINAQSAQVAVYEGSITINNFGGYTDILAGRGQWSSIPDSCKKFFSHTVSRGFALYTNNVSLLSQSGCNNATLIIDLEKSSFCQDQGGREFYAAPKLISFQCN